MLLILKIIKNVLVVKISKKQGKYEVLIGRVRHQLNAKKVNKMVLSCAVHQAKQCKTLKEDYTPTPLIQCKRERDRETERQRERERQRDREKERERERKRRKKRGVFVATCWLVKEENEFNEMKLLTFSFFISYFGIKHLKVVQDSNKYGFSVPCVYGSLMDLILHYSENSLETHNPKLTTTLAYPVYS